MNRDYNYELDVVETHITYQKELVKYHAKMAEITQKKLVSLDGTRASLQELIEKEKEE